MEPYSTLEVRGIETEGDGGNKEVVDRYESRYPQLTPFEHGRSGVPGAEAIVGTPTDHLPLTPSPDKPARTTCGLPTRRFLIIVAIGIVVCIGVIVGGVAGGLLSRRDRVENNTPSDNNTGGKDAPSNTGNSSTTTTADVKLLSTSRLASSNWTDPDGFVYRTVFFQDASNAIIARRWNSQSRTWVTSNLTSTMQDTSTPLHPLPGTPLASASCNQYTVSEVHVWFLVPDHFISSYRLRQPVTAPDDWEHDDLGGATLRTWPGSELAGARQHCWWEDCKGHWIVAYQRPNGDIDIANSTYWDTTTVVDRDRRDVADNTSLALVPQIDGSWLNPMALVSERIDSTTTGSMQKMAYQEDWESDGSVMGTLPLPSPALQFSLAPRRNFNETLFLALLPNGTVMAVLDTGTFTPPGLVHFSGGPEANFSAIAMSEDAMFYGISHGEVLEYAADGSDAFTFVYVGRVFP